MLAPQKESLLTAFILQALAPRINRYCQSWVSMLQKKAGSETQKDI
jgi:hypothetical protein